MSEPTPYPTKTRNTRNTRNIAKFSSEKLWFLVTGFDHSRQQPVTKPVTRARCPLTVLSVTGSVTGRNRPSGGPVTQKAFIFRQNFNVRYGCYGCYGFREHLTSVEVEQRRASL
jgi:hypothetical protein